MRSRSSFFSGVKRLSDLFGHLSLLRVAHIQKKEYRIEPQVSHPETQEYSAET
jgi:hypothetical protein